MYQDKLHCNDCGANYDLEIYYNCPTCGGILDVIYNLPLDPDPDLFDKDYKKGIWRFRNLLPLGNDYTPVSLQEGNTPILKSNAIAKRIDLDNLYLKDETRNPTGAFKDRPISVALSVALSQGSETVITASTGNAGAAVACYAAQAGVDAVVLAPEATPFNKLLQISSYGAKVVKIEGSFSRCFELAQQASEEFNWVNLTSTFLNPYSVEGDKTVAYEIFEQMSKVPDWVVVPTGAGPLLVGCYKGFKELKELGFTDKIPAMAGIQSEGCEPIVKAFENDEPEVSSWESPTTIASGIADPLQGYGKDGTYTLNVIRKSGGIAMSIPDKDIVAGVIELASEEGIFAEPAGATSIVALPKLIKQGFISREDSVICLITGGGFKDSDPISKILDSPITITADLRELEKVI